MKKLQLLIAFFAIVGSVGLSAKFHTQPSVRKDLRKNSKNVVTPELQDLMYESVTTRNQDFFKKEERNGGSRGLCADKIREAKNPQK